MTEYITYDTDDINLVVGDVDTVRTSLDEGNAGEKTLVTVYIKLWRDSRIEKARHCVDSLLKYNSDVKFKLALVNNGGSQKVTDFFESIDYEDKQIIHITKNISASFSAGIEERLTRTKYMVDLLNDNIVTPHWLSNMIKCLESNPKIGVACPLCTNTGGRQVPPFEETDVDKLLRISEEYNRSDSLKWEERMVIIPQGAVFRRAVYDATGIFDKGYLHEGADTDFSIRVRRAGYKQILCKDTFIIHDHNYDYEPPNPQNVQQCIKGYMEKSNGIDLVSDYNNFITEWIESIKINSKKEYKILGIDCRCGVPILDIKNKAYINGNKNITCSAFTSEIKYYQDLQSVCNNVYYDSNVTHISLMAKELYDFIVIDKNLNEYEKIFDLLEYALSHSREYVLFKVKNMTDIGCLVQCLGGKNPARWNGFRCINLDEIDKYLNDNTSLKVKIMREESRDLKYLLEENNGLKNAISSLCFDDIEKVKKELGTFRYWYLIKLNNVY